MGTEKYSNILWSVGGESFKCNLTLMYLSAFSVENSVSSINLFHIQDDKKKFGIHYGLFLEMAVSIISV